MNSADAGNRLRDVLHKRSDVLDVLADRPCTKPELIDAVGKSRSTIDRSVDDLAAVDCIEYRDGKYHPTTKGRLALAEYADYESITDTLGDAGDVLNALPSDSSVSSAFLRDATIHRANPHVPGAALDKRNELLESSTRMVGLAPTALCSYPETLVEVVHERPIEIELVVEDAVFESLSEVRSEQVESLVAHDDVDIVTTERSLPYALWVMEQDGNTYVGITVYKNGGVQGLVMNDTAEAVSWGKEVYRKYRKRVESGEESNEDTVVAR